MSYMGERTASPSPSPGLTLAILSKLMETMRRQTRPQQRPENPSRHQAMAMAPRAAAVFASALTLTKS